MASPWAQAKAGKKISAPKQSKYQGYRGQPGGMSSIPSQGKKDAFVQLQRQKFFGDRDIPEERVLRRTRQEGALNQFKNALIRQGKYAKDSAGNPIRTSSGDYVYGSQYTFDRDPSSPTFGKYVGRSPVDYALDLAYRFGPTPREVAGDIGYGLKNIAQGFAEKGTPMMQLGKAVLGGIQNFFNPKPPVATYGGSSDISVKEVPLTTSDLNVSVNPGARPEFLAAINDPGTMAQDSRLQELLMKNVPGYESLMNLGNTPYGKFGIENLLNDPRFIYEKNLGPGQLGIQINPFSQSGGFSYGMQFKNGGIATLH